MTNSNPSSKTNSGGEQAPLEGIAPITVGNPARASSFIVDQSHLEEILTDGGAQSSVVQCRRPPKGHFFTCKAEVDATWENRGVVFFLERDGCDPLVVNPEVAKGKIDEQEDTVRPVLLVRYVTMLGEEALWPIKIDRGDKANAWNVSARNILAIAEKRTWVRIRSTRGCYLHQVSRKTWEDVPPKFTDRTFKELTDIAFAGRMVDADHPIWEELRHGSTK
jgi:hypothetical protein